MDKFGSIGLLIAESLNSVRPSAYAVTNNAAPSDWQASRSWRCSHQAQRAAATMRPQGCSPLMASTFPSWRPLSQKAGPKSGSTLWRKPCLLQQRSTCTGYCALPDVALVTLTVAAEVCPLSAIHIKWGCLCLMQLYLTGKMLAAVA